ncbi:FadR/GntR family transcriptional regulator [Rugosimonospora africana]|uniref:Transcriptional regulator n=1 Tax=Rugosimonospora africana TaxID=556532 RepID=A0A8J3QW81_9ACTN|nr:FCD domain-containing protein [Rugosimonospora africana]GIH17237.1 transcriptional regulator [Rugosimonospora africana]
MTEAEPSPGRRRIPSRSNFEADLIRQILTGKLPPGEKLPGERSLAVSSGLSRPVIREVLRSLVERGLVEVLPARGAFVKAPDSMQLAGTFGSAARHQRATPRDLIEAREMIEGRAARNAALRASTQDVATLRDLVRAFDEAETMIERARCDLALHASIARMSGNPVLGILFGAIAPMVMELQLRSLADPVVLQLGAPLHHDVVEAIAAGDAETASRAMTRHVVLARDLYGEDMDVPLDELAVQRVASVLGENARLSDLIDDVLEGLKLS